MSLPLRTIMWSKLFSGVVFIFKEFPRQSVTVKETFWCKEGETESKKKKRRSIRCPSVIFLSETDKQTAARCRLITQQHSLIWALSGSYRLLHHINASTILIDQFLLLLPLIRPLSCHLSSKTYTFIPHLTFAIVKVQKDSRLWMRLLQYDIIMYCALC